MADHVFNPGFATHLFYWDNWDAHQAPDPQETLAAYKYQPHLEKRFSWTKSDYQVAPAFLKKTERIEALKFACYIADLVAAIIQRQLRTAMKANGLRQLQTLPEERPSETPTWEQVQRLFANQAKYQLTS